MADSYRSPPVHTGNRRQSYVVDQILAYIQLSASCVARALHILLKPCRPLSFAALDNEQSMYFSNFVASRLNVWNSNGRHRLEEFLAKMGFSLEQCKQKYPFMSCHLRKRLRDQIDRCADDYGLQDVMFGQWNSRGCWLRKK